MQCKLCGKGFEPVSKVQVYCSPNCKRLARNQKARVYNERKADKIKTLYALHCGVARDRNEAIALLWFKTVKDAEQELQKKGKLCFTLEEFKRVSNQFMAELEAGRLETEIIKLLKKEG